MGHTLKTILCLQKGTRSKSFSGRAICLEVLDLVNDKLDIDISWNQELVMVVSNYHQQASHMDVNVHVNVSMYLKV